ncbi:unnamed protein product [Linum tenue]|uniref:NAC domain-containing protein n=1 Tax=Linum tenue TaxID=586396 RepID=A0AAV0N6U3_9ROSI|nr:unnamed protein product [Linum tenue]
MELPAGFRFHPTDEELITHYLSPKVVNESFCARAIGEVDLNKCEPWDLPCEGEKEWYFFCVRDRKYPTGLRTNRATEAGYWKATGKDKEIYRAKVLVGMKKTLVFYKGRAPKGVKTNWVMHEYRLFSPHTLFLTSFSLTLFSLLCSIILQNEWVICRVFHKSDGGKKVHISGLVRMTSNGEETKPSELPPLMDSSCSSSHEETRNSTYNSHVPCFSNPTQDHRTQQDLAYGSDATQFPKSSVPVISSISPMGTSNFHYQDSLLMPDQSLLRMLVENNGWQTSESLKPEQVSAETGHSTDMSSNHAQLLHTSFEVSEDPSSTSAGILDLDCLWSY